MLLLFFHEICFTAPIFVTFWILNKNKNKHTTIKNNQSKNYRERNEVLFMDLRRWGSPVEKKFIELTSDDREKVTQNYHNWQQEDYKTTYKDVPEFCYSASFDELKENDFSLIPSKYIEFIDADSGIDYDTEMKRIQKSFKSLIKEEKDSQNQLTEAFKTLGYEL